VLLKEPERTLSGHGSGRTAMAANWRLGEKKCAAEELWGSLRSRLEPPDPISSTHTGWEPMRARARARRVRPGSILNQMEAPEGWGSGIRSTA
jgi:hypothetical protein